MHEKDRYFNGQRYYLASDIYWSKKRAQEAAKQYRADGYLARIVKRVSRVLYGRGAYEIYLCKA